MAKRSTPRTNSPASQEPRENNGVNAADKRPVHSIRYGRLKAAIWMNDGQTGKFYNVTFSRSYQDGQIAWHDASSFNSYDLPLLAKLANDCHSWITWQERRAKEAAAKPESSH